MTKQTIFQKVGKQGGDKTKRLYGSDHYRKIRLKGQKKLLKRDPDFYKKFAAMGLHAREAKKQAALAREIEGNKASLHAFTRFLVGKS